MNKAVDVNDLVRDFGKVRAVDHISFSVVSGEVFGFLGPNGAGKTTTVRVPTTLLEPTAGSVLIGGYDVGRQSYQARQQIGLVPEESNVYGELSAWDNLMFSARLYRVPRAESERRATQLLQAFDLYEKRLVKAQLFSKGMRRRLTIAMAFIHRPSILFLDEPTSGLDVRSAQTIKEMVRQLNAGGTTLFLTTHQIEEANQLCDRVAIIDRGRIAAIDSPEQLKRTIASVQAVEVAFDSFEESQQDLLRGLHSVTALAKQGDKWRLYTPDPPNLLTALFDYAQRQGKRIITLNTLGPSLEDVFLHLTGQEVGLARQMPDSETTSRSPKRKGGMLNG